MDNSLKERLLFLVEKRGTNPAAASKKATGKPDTIRNILRAKSRNPRSDTIEKLAHALGTSADWLIKGKGPMDVTPTVSEAIPAPLSPQPPAPHAPSRYLPVFGLAAGSVTGMLTMTNDAIEEVPAPEVLARVRDAYAVIVTGTSMEPRYTAGDYVFVHPHKPVRQGDHVIIQEFRHGGTVVSIKRFERLTETHIVTSQYNPLAEVKFLRSPEITMHRVLTSNEVAGV